jgi:hypothetical protein
LKSDFAYRVVTESVEIELGAASGGGPDGTATVTSTTVYRNMGGNGSGHLTIPQRRWARGQNGDPSLDLSATWDGAPVQLAAAASASSTGPKGIVTVNKDLLGDVPLKDQATHVLKITFKEPLQKTGYGLNQFKAAYLLTAGQPIELFTMAFRYADQVVFRQPVATPRLGWQIGPKGASMRKTNWTPGDQIAAIQFYPYGFTPIG